MKLHARVRLITFLIASCWAINSQANILWRGDFETGTTEQWHAPINPAGLSVISECVFDGKYAGKIRLPGDAAFLWQGNKYLNRSEFHHRGPVGATHESKETFFSFSFYLPKAFSNTKHELGYWESDKTWQQMLRFNITGTEFSFQQSSAKTPFWKISDGATPGLWHKVAMHIYWSTDPAKGFTQVWFDGKDMGKHFFNTLPVKDATMFTQIGILRTQENSVEEMLIDNVQETDNLTELLEKDRHLIGKVCHK